MRTNWKKQHPQSLGHALRLCKDHAREKHNRSVERIADLMGVTADLLYKWLGNGRLPANLIPAYEAHCGINFVSRWLAMSAGKLVVDIPTGKVGGTQDVLDLQEVLHAAVGSLMRFYTGKADADSTLAAIQSGMEGLALHRGNVQKHAQPELDFESCS